MSSGRETIDITVMDGRSYQADLVGDDPTPI
jgi:hypothetical protein